MDITSAIADIQAKWLSISGIRAAPDFPTAATNVYPCAMTYDYQGELQVDEMNADIWGQQTGLIVSNLLVSDTDMPRDIETITSYREAFLRKVLNDPTLSSTVKIVKRIRWTSGELTWGGVKHFSYRYEIEVELELSPS